MAAGKTDLASLGFLNETVRMRSWLNSLNQAKIAEPTVHHYLKNVAQFLAYVAETPPPTCRLSRVIMVGLNREIKSMIRSVRRKVVMHEVRVKQAKEGRLITKATLRKCLASAKAAIPEILARLQESSQRVDQMSLYGHLTAYFACIYGHRGGVFQNMTIREVEAAQETSRDGSYVVNVSGFMSPTLSLSRRSLVSVSTDFFSQDQPGLRGGPAGLERGGVWVAERVPGHEALLGGRCQRPLFLFHIKAQLMQKPEPALSGSMGWDGPARNTKFHRHPDLCRHPRQEHAQPRGLAQGVPVHVP